MKKFKFITIIIPFLLLSCNAVRVNSDFDKSVDFTQYKTYAFYKNGIDKVEISDLDKKRILRSIDNQMLKKGFAKSETPDVLINFFTKEHQQVDVTQNSGFGFGYGYRFGWNPWIMNGGYSYVNSYPEGTLYIDFIDAKKKEMIWQGEGQGALTQKSNDKDGLINEFVTKILEQYPPVLKNR